MEMKSYKDNFLYYGGILASLFILFLYFGFSVDTSVLSPFFKFISAVADGVLIVFPFIFLRGKWKFLALAIPFIISLLLWINLLYFRNFQDLIPVSQYINNQIGDETVVASIRPSSKLSDFILLTVPFLPLLITYYIGVKNVEKMKQTKPLAISLFCLLIGSWGVTFAGSYRRIGIFNELSDSNEILKKLYPAKATNWMFFYNQHNFTGYVARCMFKIHGTSINLSKEDIGFLQDYIRGKDNVRGVSHEESDSLNLILIVVESLPMKILELEGKDRLIPNLNRLVSDSSIIVNRCISLIGIGRSSDAQFMYNTGLLPLRDEPVVTNYSNKDYPSLAKALNYNSLEVIAEDGRLWSHLSTTKSYGYDNLISGIAVGGENQDSIIFQKALTEIEGIREPFYLFVTTMSMHGPYNSRRTTHELSQSDLLPFNDRRDQEYLQRVRHFDKHLGKFLDGLKSQGKYHNSVIVIVGDHEIGQQDVTELLHDNSVPFIIINSPLQEPGERISTQIDVFPTILDIFCRDYQFLGVRYHGLGESIFNNPEITDTYYPSNEDYEVSEMIIKGKY